VILCSCGVKASMALPFVDLACAGGR